MKVRFVHPLCFAALLACVTIVPLSAADSPSRTSVPLSIPGQPAVLHIDLPGSELHITGVEGDTITVEASLKQRTMITSEPGGDTKQTVPGFTLTESNNKVSLASPDNPSGALGKYQISVPRQLSLDIRNLELGGDIFVQDVTGDLEINVVNCAVRLEGVAGSVVINTVNGQVYVLYSQMPQKIISITSMNGTTDLQLPADTKANVQLRTHHGIISTDFKAAKLKTKKVRNQTNATLSPASPPTPPGGKIVSGTLNGGGVDISLSSMNGSIALRQFPATTSPADGTKDNVTVRFQDPDNFTDVLDDSSSFTSEYYLGELRDHVQAIAAPRLPVGSRLMVTFLDLDIAGDIRPDRRNIRILTGVSFPRARLQFQLLDASGQVLQEGERQLTDVNYQNSIGLVSRNEPLYFDKQLLTDWITREFKKAP